MARSFVLSCATLSLDAPLLEEDGHFGDFFWVYRHYKWRIWWQIVWDAAIMLEMYSFPVHFTNFEQADTRQSDSYH